MAPTPTVSPVTGQPVPPSYIHASTAHFQDTHGRTLLLRGVNLSGGAKAPHGRPSWDREGFWEEGDNGEGDFVNRPLNLDDGSADVHLARLRAWGFNMLRYVFTWEALEHAGPGKYDEEYMDYVVRVLKKCKEWGFRVFMDPHQDVWSRYSGGSGAPLWTLYACGIDPHHMAETYGALIHCEWPSPSAPKPATFPGMIWGTNYTRMVSQTVFTLFYAGKVFAPKCIIDGKNIQDYLQDLFFAAVETLARKIAAEPGLYEDCVIGWDSMNEPGEGMVGHPDINKTHPSVQLKKGPMPSPLEGMWMCVGQAVDVDDWYFGPLGPTKSKKVTIDPKGVKVWLDEKGERERGGGKWGWKRDPGWKLGECIWAQHGVWDPSTNTALRPEYFATYPNDPSKESHYVPDFWASHFIEYGTRLRRIHREAILFVQPPVFHRPPPLPHSILLNRAASSPHFYDGLTLMTKHWNWFNADALGMIRGKYWNVVQAVKIGDTAIKRMMQDELSTFAVDTKECLGEYPTLIGEIGCPYDMDDKKAYGFVDGGKGEGDYTMQRRAWDASMHALDGPNALNFTLWTYVPDNSHEWGDLWNGEDLSLWSRDDLEKPSEIDSAQIASTTSSTTLTSPTTPKSSFTPSSIASGAFSSSLIMDGARAIDAICRPYCIAMVGQPLRADFDFYTSDFKLTIRVSAEDAVPEGVATEVYLPFIHYAANLGDSQSSIVNRSENSSRVSLVQAAKEKEKNTNSPRTSTISTSTGTGNMTPEHLTLAADIKVSTGRTEVHGQTLKWFYAPPARGEATYTLTVKRQGGPIARASGYGGGSGSWADVCPSSCVVA